MRLDHLLSRDLGVCGGRGARTGASPGPLVARREGRTDGCTGARSSPPSWGWGVPALPRSCGGGVGACCRGLGLRALCVLLLLLSWLFAAACCGGGVGGLWGCGWVGCELYSGREYLCSLWCVFVVCLAPGSCCCCGGVWGVVSACVVCCFYGRSVDALAPGADEGRGGLR